MIKNFSHIIIFLLTIAYVGIDSHATVSFANELSESYKKIKPISEDYLKKIPDEEYILDSGDTIQIRVSEEINKIESPILINGDGTVFLPNLNRVYVAGLTINELSSILNDAYKEFILNPSVQIEIISYRPITIFIEGEVNNPGRKVLDGALSAESLKTSFNSPSLEERFDYGNELNFANKIDSINSFELNTNFYFPTIFDAIRSSGGITEYSDLKRVLIVRKDTLSNNGGFKSTELNLEKSLTFEDASQNIRILDGDRIIMQRLSKPNQSSIIDAIEYDLNPKFINVSVFGRVNAPGKITLTRKSTLNDAITISGGAKTLRGKIKLISFENNGAIQNRIINYKKRNSRGSKNNPFLKEGDLIIIDSSFLSNSSEVIAELTSPFQGLFSTYGLIKAISD